MTTKNPEIETCVQTREQLCVPASLDSGKRVIDGQHRVAGLMAEDPSGKKAQVALHAFFKKGTANAN